MSMSTFYEICKKIDKELRETGVVSVALRVELRMALNAAGVEADAVPEPQAQERVAVGKLADKMMALRRVGGNSAVAVVKNGSIAVADESGWHRLSVFVGWKAEGLATLKDIAKLPSEPLGFEHPAALDDSVFHFTQTGESVAVDVEELARLGKFAQQDTLRPMFNSVVNVGGKAWSSDGFAIAVEDSKLTKDTVIPLPLVNWVRLIGAKSFTLEYGESPYLSEEWATVYGRPKKVGDKLVTQPAYRVVVGDYVFEGYLNKPEDAPDYTRIMPQGQPKYTALMGKKNWEDNVGKLAEIAIPVIDLVLVSFNGEMTGYSFSEESPRGTVADAMNKGEAADVVKAAVNAVGGVRMTPLAGEGTGEGEVIAISTKILSKIKPVGLVTVKVYGRTQPVVISDGKTTWAVMPMRLS